MAIALDTSGGTAFGGTTQTLSYTMGSVTNGLLVVGVFDAGGTGTDHVTGVTYGGVSLTQIGTPEYNSGAADVSVTMWVLINPTAGTANLVASASAGGVLAIAASSYSGANQSTTPDSHAQTHTTVDAGTYAISTTVVGANCWLISPVVSGSKGNPIAGSGTTERYQGASGNATGDSNGTVSTGSQTLNWSTNGQGNAHWVGHVVSWAPAVAATTNDAPFFGADF